MSKGEVYIIVPLVATRGVKIPFDSISKESIDIKEMCSIENDLLLNGCQDVLRSIITNIKRAVCEIHQVSVLTEN